MKLDFYGIKYVFLELFLEPEDVQYDDRPDRQLFPGQLHIARTKGRSDVLSAGLVQTIWHYHN